MAVDPKTWMTAYQRFGHGARGGETARNGDPREALLAEIADAKATRLDGPDLRGTSALLKDVYAYDQRKKQEADDAALAKLASAAMPDPAAAERLFPAPAPAPAKPAETAAKIEFLGKGDMLKPDMAAKPDQPPQQVAFRADALARLKRAYDAPIGFGERLVAFWSNHFCVSVAKSNIGRAAAGAFEREAIRPHVLGHFSEMLLAVEQHPTMLNFLDNAQSIGPNSLAGHNNRSGLNENLAREILELHTMGVGSGYTQTDVTQLAYIITGWTIAGRDAKLGEPGAFAFNPNAHEPLAATLRDRLYMQDGVDQGVAALRDLAQEPATAAHIAYKFARHFVADKPDAGLVARLTDVFRNSDGHLGALARALVTDPVAWSAPASKMRNPWELTVASFRAFGREPTDPGPALNAMGLLGMPLWEPAGPNGFSDEAAAWMSPEGMKTRLELAAQFAHQTKAGPKPIDLLETVFGPAATPATREAIQRAETPEQAYALLLLSPEFQRR